MTVLITGGAGFIGSNFLHFLKESNPTRRLINLDALTYAGNLKNVASLEKSTHYRFVHGNILDQELLKNIIQKEKIETIIHFAAESHVDRSIQSPEKFVQTNVFGTVAILEVMRQFPSVELIHISTDEVYGALESGYASEKDILNPSSPYAASKAAAEHFVQAYGKTYGCRYKIVRAANNYGPRQFEEKLVPLMIKNILDKKELPLYGNGKNIRDWLYVKDFCRAIALVWEKGENGEIYNVSAHEEHTNLEIIKKLCHILHYDDGMIRFVKDRLGHDFRYAINTDKIESLGFKAQVSFEEGLNQTINWYQKLEHFDC